MDGENGFPLADLWQGGRRTGKSDQQWNRNNHCQMSYSSESLTFIQFTSPIILEHCRAIWLNCKSQQSKGNINTTRGAATKNPKELKESGPSWRFLLIPSSQTIDFFIYIRLFCVCLNLFSPLCFLSTLFNWCPLRPTAQSWHSAIILLPITNQLSHRLDAIGYIPPQIFCVVMYLQVTSDSQWPYELAVQFLETQGSASFVDSIHFKPVFIFVFHLSLLPSPLAQNYHFPPALCSQDRSHIQ